MPTSRFRDRQLPEVCARTGLLARNRYGVSATYTPRWTLWLAPFGLLPYVVAAALTRTTIEGALPLNQSAARRLSVGRFVTVAGVAIGVCLALLALAISSLSTAIAATLFTAVGVGAFFVLRQLSVRATLSADGTQVTLRHVHDDFVTAVQKPPSKCAGCTNSSSCSVAEIDACDGSSAAHHEAPAAIS